MHTEGQPLDLSKIVVARKLSVLEYDGRNLGLTRKETLEHYKETGTDWETILSSHRRQMQSLHDLSQALPGTEIVTGFELTRDFAETADAVVALGGDDHYQYVSHFIDNQLLVPINSDTVKSTGALAEFTVPSFIQFLDRLKNGNFSVEEWTRLQVTLNDKPIRELAISQVFIGSVDNEDMGRYVVEYGGQKEAQKTSGMLVATGTGSGKGSWYDAANRYLFPNGNRFERSTQKAVFIPREPNNGSLNDLKLKAGEILPGEPLIFTSLMNKDGRVGIDALVKKDFPRGSKAVVEISDKPLRVISPNLAQTSVEKIGP